MVKLEEVLDESFKEGQTGPRDEEDWDTDDSDADSVASDASSTLDTDESLLERLAALKDIVPPSTRRSLSSGLQSTTSFLSSSARWSGKALWIVSTSVLLVGVPWALAMAEEQQMEMMENEMKAQEQAGQMMTQGAGDGGQQAKAAL